jgi:hypothetical protein
MSTATPISFPPNSVVAQVQGEWDQNNTPVVYSLQAQATQYMAVVLLAGGVAATSVTSPSGQDLGGGMNGVGFNSPLQESGTYTITVSRNQMGESGGSFTLVVVLGPVL